MRAQSQGAEPDHARRPDPGMGGAVRHRRRLAVALAGLALLLLAAPVAAQQDQPTDDEVNAIAKGLYCPVCENVPLDVCPTLACKQWRETIREKLAAGWTKAEIEDYFVAQYGDRVLATPPPSGLNWLVYVLPPLAFVAGAVILTRAARSWRQAGDVTPAISTAGQSDPYLQQLEDELQRRA